MKIILWFFSCRFFWLFIPYLCRHLSMPGHCYAERIITNANLYYWSLFLRWDLVISSRFTLPYFDALNTWVLNSPLLLRSLKREQIATTCHSVELSQYTQERCWTFSNNYAVSCTSHSFLSLAAWSQSPPSIFGSKTALELTGSQRLQRWLDSIGFR